MLNDQSDETSLDGVVAFRGSITEFFEFQNRRRAEQELARKNAVEAEIAVIERCSREDGGHLWERIEDPIPRLKFCRKVYRCKKGCGAERAF